MAQNVTKVIGKCISKKAFWSFLVISATCIFLLFEHAYRECAIMLVFVMIALFAVYEEYNDDENDYTDCILNAHRTIQIENPGHQ
jgi:hypothetical protein